ncbi:ATP-binding protein [Candidatus Parcubacteria bacterium]|nr:ATP-binding protein [Candidatus Parcubacteria bacterium]
MLNKIFKKKTENVETATNRQDLQQKEAPVAMVSSKKKGVFGKILDLRKKKDPKSSEAGPERDFVEGLVSTKDIIAPSAIEVDFNHIRINNKYYRTLFVAGYPRFVGMNWLSPLVNFDASLNVSMYIYPIDGKEILDDLRRKIAEMEAELSTDIQRGKIVNPATQAKLEDALNLQADLVKGEERFFQFGLYVTISCDEKKELDKITKNLESSLGALMIISKKTTLQMEEGFITTLPICDDRLKITRNMDTTSLATTFPFVSSDLSDDNGIMYGINEHNGSLVIFDRFGMENYNSVVFATSGAGKSYMIKLEVLRSLMLGTEIIVIDPENEYEDLCEAVGGQYIAFGYSEDSKINPFDLSLMVEEGENALNSKVLALHKLLKVMLGKLDPIEESMIDKAVMAAYKMKGITPDTETQNKEAPLIEDLYKSLIGMEEEKAQSLAARLEKYIKGSFAGVFNQKTTVDLKNKFVVFGIRNLEEALRPVAMHIILDYIWTVIRRDLKKRILVVEEAWVLMKHEDSADFLRGIVKRGRKYFLGTTTITQDVDDFLQSEYGKEIVTNSAIQILLKQHSAAIDKIGEVFYLSEGEKQLLLTADQGEGIFFAGQNHVAIRVIASPDEHRLITSDPSEILKMKKQADVLKEAMRSKPAKLTSHKAPTPTPTPTPTVISAPAVESKDQNLAGGKLAVEVVGEDDKTTSEFDLEEKIKKLEEKEKVEIEKHKIAKDEEERVKKETEEQKKKLVGNFGSFGKLPKYGELFKSSGGGKLPPLPVMPKITKAQVPVKSPIAEEKPTGLPEENKWTEHNKKINQDFKKGPPVNAEPVKTDGEQNKKDKKENVSYEEMFG